MLPSNSPINTALQTATSQAAYYGLKRTHESISRLSLKLTTFGPLTDMHRPIILDAVEGVRSSYELDVAMVRYKRACAEDLAKKRAERSWWFGEGTYPDIMVRVLDNETDYVVHDGRKRYIIIPDGPEPGDREHPAYFAAKDLPQIVKKSSLWNPNGIGAVVALAAGITLYNTNFGKGDLRTELIKSAIENGAIFLALGAMLFMEWRGISVREHPGRFSNSWEYFSDTEAVWKNVQNTLALIEQIFRWDSTLPVRPRG